MSSSSARPAASARRSATASPAPGPGSASRPATPRGCASLAADLAEQARDGVVVTTVAADLTAPDGPRRVVDEVAEAGPLTGLVNAAGVVAFGPVAELDDDTLDDLLLLDLIAPIRLTRAALGHLGQGGFLVQLSAVVAEKPMAGMAAYSAAKAGLTAFDAALATELRRHRIRVLDVRPPHTETGLAGRPVAGEAPTLPTGLDPGAVAERIVRAILDDERDLPASAF